MPIHQRAGAQGDNVVGAGTALDNPQHSNDNQVICLLQELQASVQASNLTQMEQDDKLDRQQTQISRILEMLTHQGGGGARLSDDAPQSYEELGPRKLTRRRSSGAVIERAIENQHALVNRAIHSFNNGQDDRRGSDVDEALLHMVARRALTARGESRTCMLSPKSSVRLTWDIGIISRRCWSILQ